MASSHTPLSLAVVDAMARASAMDELAAYAADGRAYRRHTTKRLRLMWVGAFRKWFNSDFPKSSDYKNVADIRAELSLRGELPPYETVQTDLDCARHFAMEDSAIGRHVMQQIMHDYNQRGLAN